MKLPALELAEAMLSEAEKMNPGIWIKHSRFAAQAARNIAQKHPGLEPDNAYILGLLHDIGRRAGVTDLRHIFDGYNYMLAAGFEDVARICLTHSFPAQHLGVVAGQWDCTPDEFNFIKNYLEKVEYNAYDKLIQLSDALTNGTGFCLIEKRLINVAIRRGMNDFTLLKWKATFQIQQDFEAIIGSSIYQLLPGVVENTFQLI